MNSKPDSLAKSFHPTGRAQFKFLSQGNHNSLNCWIDGSDLSEVIRGANVRFLNAKGLVGWLKNNAYEGEKGKKVREAHISYVKVRQVT